jgi:hypothetical protein
MVVWEPTTGVELISTRRISTMMKVARALGRGAATTVIVAGALLGGAAAASADTGSTGGGITALPPAGTATSLENGTQVTVIDVATGDTVDSYTYHAPIVSPLISIVGPGCSSNSVCVYPSYGYQGVGSITVKLPGATGR